MAKLSEHISCFEMDGRESIGYWVDHCWGKGDCVAGARLFLGVVERRPARPGGARQCGSIRVLEKCGFVLTGYEWSEETERFPACEEAVFELV